jgi:hypothetical protein
MPSCTILLRAPTILLSNPNGITNKDVELLKKELLDKSKELIGMVIFYIRFYERLNNLGDDL